MARVTLDPKLDVVFKLLFAAERNRDILRSFLTAVQRNGHLTVILRSHD